MTRPSGTNVVRILLSRVELVRHLHNLGLKIGNKVKQLLDIPDWIKVNPEYSKVCLRGLIDTDGCVFRHNYKVN